MLNTFTQYAEDVFKDWVNKLSENLPHKVFVVIGVNFLK